MQQLDRAQVPNILILGAGPVGLTLACELLRHGVSCRVVDKAEATTKWSKALVVHARTMEIFERMGILERAIERGRRVRGASIQSEGREILRIDLDTLDAPHNFFLDLNQADTEASNSLSRSAAPWNGIRKPWPWSRTPPASGWHFAAKKARGSRRF